ncbi:sensor histidine kinase [Vibrio ezurae]|nr:sensor histidine kinase [Vibrio ezurae]
MNKARNTFWLWLILISLIPNAVHANSSTTFIDNNEKSAVDIGVLAIRGQLHAQHRWQPTIDWLNTQIPEVHFVLHALSLTQMTQAVESQNMDFILTNPGQALRLGRQYPLSWMATLTNLSSEGYGIGSALVVRSNSTYTQLQDLVGLPIAAVSEQAFGGYLTMRYQVIQKGINPNDFFANVQFLGFPIDANLYQLRDHNVEAAVVPACLLEQMTNEGLLENGGFRVISPIASLHSHCAVSTTLYPNWSFAKTQRGSPLLAKKISRALLAINADNPAAIAAKTSGWTSPVSLLSIDKLYQAMDLHPLQQPLWKESLRWLRFNQEWAWGLFVFVILINIYHFWLEYRFSKSKQELENTLLRLKEKSEMLEHAQRITIVRELGTSLAHEINQPLAAIRNYSEGGLLRLAKKRPYEDIVPVLHHIQDQVERADAIIRRLRTLIKKRTVTIVPYSIEEIIHDTLELLRFRLQNTNTTVVQSSAGQPRKIDVDIVGLQQVLVNIINNAIDACVTYGEQEQAEFSGKITIHTHYQTKSLVIHIIDNGTGLTQENLIRTFESTKQEGLGLGLAICRDVMELHGGEFTLQSMSSHGCLAKLILPYQTARRTLQTTKENND